MKKRDWFIIIGILLIITIGLLFVIFNIVEVGDERVDDDSESIGIEGNYECSVDSYNCEDFEDYDEILKVYDFCGGMENDVHGLDKDGDGEPCESLGE